MRIIAGEWRGRRLRPAPGTRPTGDRVREALFSILGGHLSGTFVDAYAGSGAVGIEARSRGARVVLVEREPAALEVLRENLEALGAEAEGEVTVVADDALRFFKDPRAMGPGPWDPVDTVFADPPYDYHAHDKLLRTVARSALVGPRTLVVLEHRRGLRQARTGPLRLVRQESYGETTLSFFETADNRALASSSEASVG